MTSVVTYGIGDTPIGKILVATTGKGVCALRLLCREKLDDALRAIRRDHADAEFARDDSAIADVVKHVCACLSGKTPTGKLSFDAGGTPFYQKVWRAMTRVPAGTTCSYQDLARRVGNPRGSRAVAQACARNPIAILVPCHRIVRSDGSLGGYYYGLDVKLKLLELESVHA